MTIPTIDTDAAFASFDAQNAGQPVLVNFVASWCMPCKSLKPVVDDLAEIYRDALVACRVDIEDCPATADRFGVKSVPTTTLRRGGEELLRVVGTTSKTRLATALDAVLATSAAGEPR